MAYEIDITGEIGNGWGYPANYLRYQLADAGTQPITINISSPGGEVTEGLAMFDMLEAYQGEVTTLGYGLVASIASVVLLAGKRVKMTPNSFLMIHNPWTMTVGDAAELTATADLLGKMEEKLKKIYVDKITASGKASGNIELKVKRMMDAETWLTAQEALEMGFVDEIQEAEKQANIVQMQPALARYMHTPAALLLNNNPNHMTAQDVLKKVKAIVGGVDEVETATAVQEPTPAPAAPAAPEITAEQARELLEKTGYKVMTADEVAALTAKTGELENTNKELAETLQALAGEMKTIKAQLKQTIAAPSGASAASTGDSSAKTGEGKAVFGAFSNFLTEKFKA